MIRKIDVESVFGNVQRTSYEYMNLLSKTKKDNFKTLVIDDKDGLHFIPFAANPSSIETDKIDSLLIRIRFKILSFSLEL